MVDPRNFIATDADIHESQDLLEKFKTGTTPAGTTDEDLWKAKNMVNGCVHPALGEIIHPVGRMAGFVPFNVPMVAGMLVTQSMGGQLFFQWLNQTYNSGLNYANRAGSEVSTEKLVTNYALAVGSACGLAASLKHATKVGPPMIQKLGAKPWAIPYLSVGLSGAANIYFSRRGEIETGVPVCRADGVVVGTSGEAAKQGIFQTVVSRGLGLPLPVLVLPPLLVGAVSKLPGLGSPRMKAPLELAAVTVCLCGALPAAIAAFPQKLELSAASLEPRFHNLKDADGNAVTTLYSNKGL